VRRDPTTSVTEQVLAILETHAGCTQSASHALLFILFTGMGSLWLRCAFVYIAVILGAGPLWYAIKGCHHIGTLTTHAAPST
jgi:hypothetical protein